MADYKSRFRKIVEDSLKVSGVHTWGDMSLAEMRKMGGAADFGGGSSGDQEYSGRTSLRRLWDTYSSRQGDLCICVQT